MTEKTSHHHGNLRDALVDAGLAILSDQGFDALTLRKAAARAGVSHAAPAHHFHGKEGLMVAIAARGFDTFTRCMQEDRYLRGRGPWAQLVGISLGYLRFAEQHESLFRLIFDRQYKNHADATLQAASREAYEVLAEVCALFEPSPAGAGVNEMAVWSVVHGYASLRHFTRGQSPETGAPIPIESLLPRLTPRR